MFPEVAVAKAKVFPSQIVASEPAATIGPLVIVNLITSVTIELQATLLALTVKYTYPKLISS